MSIIKLDLIRMILCRVGRIIMWQESLNKCKKCLCGRIIARDKNKFKWLINCVKKIIVWPDFKSAWQKIKTSDDNRINDSNIGFSNEVLCSGCILKIIVFVDSGFAFQHDSCFQIWFRIKQFIFKASRRFNYLNFQN